MRPRTLLASLILMLAAGAVRADVNQAPPILREVELRQNLNAQVPLDVEFRDEHGQTVTLGDCMAGKPTILVLAYYRCPKVCSQLLTDLTLGLRGVPLALGDDYRVVTVSIDDREKPDLAAAKKQSYIDKLGLPGMEKGWHFLTGEQPAILRLANAVGYQFRWDPKNDLFAHPTCIMILTPQGKTSRYLLRLRDPDRSGEFSRDLRLGLVEASEQKIGTKTDTILLFCYRYDPETGKYTMTALNLVRAGGVVTVLVLGSALWLMWRREWHRNKPAAPATEESTPIPGASS
jgi:protein SCO1